MARVLAAGETVSNFVESSIRTNIERRRTRAEFIARGLVSLAQAEHTSTWLNFRVDFTTEARENLQRLYEHLLERATTVEELHHAVRATDEIALAAESLIAFQPVSPASWRVPPWLSPHLDAPRSVRSPSEDPNPHRCFCPPSHLLLLLTVCSRPWREYHRRQEQQESQFRSLAMFWHSRPALPRYQHFVLHHPFPLRLPHALPWWLSKLYSNSR